MNRLATADRVRVIAALIEGVGINATCRMTGVAKNTVLKLLAELGEACEKLHDERVVNLKSKRVQCDEIWAFCHCKKRNVPEKHRGIFGFGDVWTWTAIDADSKLIVNWHIGNRDARDANEFMSGLAYRFVNPIHVTTDGLHAYWGAIINQLGEQCSSYAQCVKIYKDSYGGSKEAKYSAGECIGVEVTVKFGDPDPDAISTSYVERHNLTIRMSNRRFTRLTNAHSKKLVNHCHAIALNLVHYNFCRIHSTLRVTPAMEAGLTDHVWEIEELLDLLA